MRQILASEPLVVQKGSRVSSAASLHQDVAVLTIYSPEKLDSERVQVAVSPDGKRFVPLIYKGSVVKIQGPDMAINVPIPACKSFRLECDSIEQDERVFVALELLEM